MSSKYRMEGETVVSIKPVSYTHLDVYKRQFEERIKKNYLCEIPLLSVA